MKRFTFAVCVSCGVQSQPIILEESPAADIATSLEAMGWKFDRLRFNVAATCPTCLAKKKNREKETV